MGVDLTSVMIVLALQLVALSWRVTRELNGNEPHPFPWVPVPDNVNIAAMLAVLYFCIVAPLTTVGVRLYSVTVLGRAAFLAALSVMVCERGLPATCLAPSPRRPSIVGRAVALHRWPTSHWRQWGAR